MACKELERRGSSAKGESLRDQSVLAQYRALFAAKGVPGLVATMVVARMPTGCLAMLLVLFVGTQYGAALAGAASAAWTMGLAVASPYLGRLVDRGWGPLTLRIAAVLEGGAVLVLVVATALGAPAVLVVASAVAAGALNPPVAGTTRSLWRVLVSEELLPIAYSFEILLIDVLYVSGPLVAGVFIALGIPEWGMIFTTACLVVGSVVLAASGPVKQYALLGKQAYAAGAATGEAVGTADGMTEAVEAGTAAAPAARPLLRSASVWAVLIACMGAMMYSGWMETLIPLHFEALGSAAQGSVVISLWSIGSIVGVLGFVRVQGKFSRFGLPGQLVIFTTLYLVPTVAVAFLAGAGYAALCVAMMLVGLLVSPCTNLHYQVGGQCAPPAQHAEMFSWLNTATSAGISLGALLAGSSIELLGPDASFGVPFVFVALSLVAAVFLRRFGGKRGA